MSVELSVKTQLIKIAEDLKKIAEANAEVEQSFKKISKTADDSFKKSTKSTETGLKTMASNTRRVLNALKDDFRSLIALNATVGALKLSEQFRGSFREAVTLSDAIRKVGAILGLTGDKFTSFQNRLQKGFGKIGLSGEAAANAIMGISKTAVRNQDAILEYAKAAGMLASLGGEQGREGDIAQGLAGVIQARGGNVNDPKQMQAVAEDLRRARIATGASPTEILNDMKDALSTMSDEFRKSIGTRGLTNIMAAGRIAGPAATDFLKQYLSMDKIQRMALEAQGFKGIVGKEGINVDQFKKAFGELSSRFGGDARVGLKTAGMTDEQAEGFIRLQQSLEQVADAQKKVQTMNGSLEQSYLDARTMGESFKASLNRVKGMFSEAFSATTQGLTDILNKASQSDAGAAGIVAGGGLLAAVLAGGGLKGMGKGLLGSVAKGAAAEAITGKEVQPVYVVNAAEIAAGGALGGMGGMGGKLGGMAGKLGAVGMGLGVGVAAGNFIKEKFQTDEKIDAALSGTKLEEGIQSLILAVNKLTGNDFGRIKTPTVRVDFADPRLKKAQEPNRGTAQ